MLVDKLFKRRLTRQAFISAGAPILGLVLLVVLGAFAVFFNFAQQQDRSYVDNTRRLVANTLNGRQHALADVTLDYANWTDAYNAISRRWNGAWVEANFYSVVTDAMVIFHRDGSVRYVWKAEAVQANAAALAQQIVRAARDIPSLPSLATAPHAPGTVAHTLTMLDGRPAVLSVAAISPEDDTARLRHAASGSVDYLATIDILQPAQLNALASDLDLNNFRVSQRHATNSDVVALPLHASNGALLGYAQWRNEHPGRAALAAQLGPVVLGVIVIGALSILIALVLMQRQVSAVARAEAALESSRLKSEFISNMSHELRTPLDAIIGYTELIQEETPRGTLFDPVRRDAGRITESANRLRQLIDDVLDHSRIDAGRLRLAPEPINVVELFAELEDALEAPLRAQSNKLEFVCDNARLYLVSDHQRLRQCLLNLAHNCIAFTRGGEISISARAEVAGDGEQIVFEVRDNGLGVARAAAATLFEPFAQTSAATRGRRGGTLSLSIARKLARLMGGDLIFDGDPSGGARFLLTMPVGGQALLANAA